MQVLGRVRIYLAEAAAHGSLCVWVLAGLYLSHVPQLHTILGRTLYHSPSPMLNQGEGTLFPYP